jgi:hypothetical protein
VNVSPLFGFAQFEFTRTLGPYDGRYVVRRELEAAGAPQLRRIDELTGVTRQVGGADVLVLSIVDERRSWLRWRRRAHYVASGAAPDPVPLMRATYVKGTEPIEGARPADERLQAASCPIDGEPQWVTEGLAVLNVAIRAHRAGARDPYVREVTLADVCCLRIGYGSTREVRDGRWDVAIEVRRRDDAQDSRSGDVLPTVSVGVSGVVRGIVLESEELLLRGVLDLHYGRTRAAAQQIRGATALAASELARMDGARGEAALLSGCSATARRVAESAVLRSLKTSEIAELEQIVRSVAQAIDAWRSRGA